MVGWPGATRLPRGGLEARRVLAPLGPSFDGSDWERPGGGTPGSMIRVLVALSPRMYRETIALSIHRRRPGLDVRSAPPEYAGRELAAFRPHLLVHNDTAPIPEDVLAGVPSRVEVLYSDSMRAKAHVGGRVEEVGDMDFGGLLGVVDAAAGPPHGEIPSAEGRGAALP